MTLIAETPDSALELPQWATDAHFHDFSVKGIKTIEFIERRHIGSPPSFESGSLRNEYLNVSAHGYWQDTRIDAEITDSSLPFNDLSGNRVEVTHPNYHFLFGQFQSSFMNQKLLKLNDQIDGIQIDYMANGHMAGLLMSSPKGQLKTERLRGNGSQGPYTLLYAPMVPESEQIELDGQRLIRDSDYTIDYSTGQFRLKNRIPSDQTEMVIRYDAFNQGFSDNVFAIKYGYGGVKNNLFQLAYVSKRTNELVPTLSVTQRSQLWISESVTHNEWSVNGELATSLFQPSIYNPSSEKNGWASALEGKYTGQVLSGSAYLVKADSRYAGLSNEFLSPGDFRYGSVIQFGPEGVRLYGKFDTEKIMFNSSPQKNEVSGAGVSTSLGQMQLSGTTEWRYFEQGGETPMEQFSRNQMGISSSMPLWKGRASAQLSQDLLQDHLVADRSVQSITTGLGYNLDLSEYAVVSIEPAYKRDRYTSYSVSEKILRLGTQYRPDRANSISGKAEFHRYSNRPDTSLAAVTARLAPTDTLEGGLNLTHEALKEQLNGQWVDIETWDINSDMSWSPWSQAKAKVGYRPKQRIIKPDRIAQFDRSEQIFEFSTPMGPHRLSVIKRVQNEFKTQTLYFPNGLYLDDLNYDNTEVIRGKFKLGSHWGVDSEVQFSTKLNRDLVSTTNGKTLDSLSFLNREKADVVIQAYPNTWTLGVEDTRTRYVSPTENQDVATAGSISVNTQWSSNLMTLVKLSVIRNIQGIEQFSSVKPELECLFRPARWVSLNFKYSLLTEFRQMAMSQENWRTDVKAEITQQFSLDMGFMQENHKNPDFSTYELGIKSSIVL